MAYVPGNPDDEEAKRKAAAGTPPGSFGDTTPTSTPTKTNFVNVSEYLGKNPDASKNLGDMAVGKLEGERDAAKGAVLDTQSKFGQQVEGGSTKLDNDFLSGALSNPTGTASNPESMAKFMALRDASYKGPQSVETTDLFAPTQAKVTALGQKAQGIGTEAGRNSLVEGLSVNPTEGKTSLNQLLLQGNPDAAERVSNAAGSFKDVDSQWQAFLQSAPGQVSQAKASTDQAREATRSGLKQATDSFSTQLKDQTTKATQDRDAFNMKYQNVNKAISDNSFDSTTLSDAGLGKDAYPYMQKLQSLNQGLGYYNSPVQLSNYATTPGNANTNVPTAASVASPEQYAREAALQQMSGADLGLPDQMETPYSANGNMPTLDYMGAFGKAGSELSRLDSDLLKTNAGVKEWAYAAPNSPNMPITPELQAGLLSAMNRQGSAGYYSDVNASLTPPAGPSVLTAQQAGVPEGTPPQYPQPTSPPPTNLINPVWNPYTGQWTGAQLQPNTPTVNQGGVFRSGGVI